jgi:hypothetical protein
MPNDVKFQGWTSVLSSVRTPLGFFTLVALILDGVLVALAAAGKVNILAPIILLGLLCVGVSAIVILKPLALYHPSEWAAADKKNVRVTVALTFPDGIQPFEVDFDTEKCVIDVRDMLNQARYKGPPNTIFGEGGWALRLPDTIEPGDNVRLNLADTQGRRWRVNPFNPFATSQRLFLIQGE